jgi:hypothetical protein
MGRKLVRRLTHLRAFTEKPIALINMKSAKTLDLTIPLTLLGRTDKVIE